MLKNLTHHINELFQPRELILTFPVILICLFVMLLAPDSILLLRYETHSVNQGELWRLITANFTHSNWNHALLNLAGLVIIDRLLGQFIEVAKRAYLLIFCFALNVIVLHFIKELDWYVGASGALHGYLLGGSLLLWNSKDKAELFLFFKSLCFNVKPIFRLVSIGVVAKVFVELNWNINQSTAELIGTQVLAEAHLSGLIAALLAVIFYPSFYHIFFKN
ncbi:rhombosortase [Aliikangiella sp. G2MR2-5]|uniref:rhombosortase n=1 Tax=Aliikangiella sp. G2MR2-5 TaxID=2788943 RepID=UPI0018AC35AE|nr:rhombosortase [Aliikangiella sp. G2MR2-5]